MALVELLGEKLQKKGESEDEYETVETKTLTGKDLYIGLYFSGHWCGPCRGFTPELVKFYNEFKGDFEIVFVSSDKDEDSFDTYFEEMPWLALPYSDRKIKSELSEEFNVTGIPTLVIVKADTADVMTVNGREAVLEDPTGKEFPWKE